MHEIVTLGLGKRLNWLTNLDPNPLSIEFLFVVCCMAWYLELRKQINPFSAQNNFLGHEIDYSNILQNIIE